MIYNLVLGIHILVCLVLIIVVLMQSSKGGGLAGAFGGGGDQVFGGHETATFLNKATTYLAVGFMVLSLALAFLTSRRSVGRPESAIRQSLQQQGNVIPRGESVDDILGATLDSAAAPADTTQ